MKVVAITMQVTHAHKYHMAIKQFKMIKYVLVIVLWSGYFKYLYFPLQET